jgi:hypothetical protein
MTAGRIIMIALGGIVVLGILAAGGGYYWWQTEGVKLRDDGQAAIAEAAEFGPTTDNHGCLNESLERYMQCGDGFSCAVVTNLYLDRCLEESSPAEGFCDGVPASDSITDSVTWRLAQCEQHGLTGSNCGNLFSQVQSFCEPPAPEPAA